jgi:corrinoid protein of di/trimethylamine methyltransferase
MDLDKIKSSLIALDDAKVKILVQQALDEKVKAEEILEKGLVPGMVEVGRLFSRKEYFVPEILVAAEAFYAGFNLIDPWLKKTAARKREKIMIAVVEGDIHDIGKNIVKVMLEANGYRVLDLGKDVKTSKLLEEAAREKPDVLCLSSLMTTTMVRMREIIDRLHAMNLRDKIKIVIGGAPVTEDYARQISADGYASDAAAAVNLIDKLIHEK